MSPKIQHDVGVRVQAVALLEAGHPASEVAAITGMSAPSVIRMRKKAIERGYNPAVSRKIFSAYVMDAPRTGRPRKDDESPDVDEATIRRRKKRRKNPDQIVGWQGPLEKVMEKEKALLEKKKLALEKGGESTTSQAQSSQMAPTTGTAMHNAMELATSNRAPPPVLSGTLPQMNNDPVVETSFHPQPATISTSVNNEGIAQPIEGLPLSPSRSETPASPSKSSAGNDDDDAEGMTDEDDDDGDSDGDGEERNLYGSNRAGKRLATRRPISTTTVVSNQAEVDEVEDEALG